MKLLLFLVSFVLTRMVRAQCGANLKEAGNCVAQVANAQFKEKDIKAEIKDCFEKSGCTAPQMTDGLVDMDDFWLGELLENIAIKLKGLDVEGLGQEVGSMKNNFLRCTMQTMEQMKPEAEACMQAKDKFTDFSFPDFFDNLGEKQIDAKLKFEINAMIDFFGFGLGGKRENKMAPQLLAAALDNEVCPTVENKENLEGCVASELPAPQISCKDMKECQAKLGDDCKDIKKELIKELCSCSHGFIDNKITELFTNMKTCLETQLQIENLIPAGIPLNLAKKVAQKMSKNILTSYCSKVDTMEGPLKDTCG